MKISKQQLIEMNACDECLNRFIEQTSNTDESVDVLSLIGGKNTYSDLLWLAGRTLPKEKIIKFACDVALINIELIKPYTDDYDLIVDFLNNPTARDAATTVAFATARDTTAAADVVYDAARDAALAARDTALAARDTATTARDATTTTARDAALAARDTATTAACAAAAAAAAAAACAAAACAAAAADVVYDAIRGKEQIEQLLVDLFTKG